MREIVHHASVAATGSLSPSTAWPSWADDRLSKEVGLNRNELLSEASKPGASTLPAHTERSTRMIVTYTNQRYVCGHVMPNRSVSTRNRLFPRASTENPALDLRFRQQLVDLSRTVTDSIAALPSVSPMTGAAVLFDLPRRRVSARRVSVPLTGDSHGGDRSRVQLSCIPGPSADLDTSAGEEFDLPLTAIAGGGGTVVAGT